MGKITITYHAPEGDDPVVTTRGVRFFDGQPKEVDAVENADLIAKARNNRFFEVKGAPEAQAKQPADESPEDDEVKAVHRGRGNFSIMKGEVELKKGLTKDEADEFNEQPADVRAGFVG